MRDPDLLSRVAHGSEVHGPVGPRGHAAAVETVRPHVDAMVRVEGEGLAVVGRDADAEAVHHPLEALYEELAGRRVEHRAVLERRTRDGEVGYVDIARGRL